MAIRSTTLRPGLLVSLKTSLTGNIRYDKAIIEPERIDANGTARAKWETAKTIEDKAEHERAEKARSKAASIIRGVCSHSAFGLLCPEADGDKLEAAMREARAITEAFNQTAALSRIGVYIITGRIAADDAEAVKAINSEMADILERMRQGVKDLDVKAIRDAADKARDLGAMLPQEVQARAQLAIDAARKAAREIVKAGEAAAVEVDTRAVRAITEARTAFLDLESTAETQAPEEEARAINLGTAEAEADAPVMVAAPDAPQLAMEL